MLQRYSTPEKMRYLQHNEASVDNCTLLLLYHHCAYLYKYLKIDNNACTQHTRNWIYFRVNIYQRNAQTCGNLYNTRVLTSLTNETFLLTGNWFPK
jgi:hypothetical protein